MDWKAPEHCFQTMVWNIWYSTHPNNFHGMAAKGRCPILLILWDFETFGAPAMQYANVHPTAISARASHSYSHGSGHVRRKQTRDLRSAFSFADPCFLLPLASFFAPAQAETLPKGWMNKNYSYLCDIKRRPNDSTFYVGCLFL